MTKNQDAAEKLVLEPGKVPIRRECLLAILLPRLRLAKNLPWPIKGFVSEGIHFRDAGLGDWTEFYDWLRDSAGNVLGVRYWLRADTEFLADYARGLDYVQAVTSRYIEIYFSGPQEPNPEFSCDQDFLYDAVFRSDDGVYAIGFGMGGLSDSDLHSLENVGAHWVDAAGVPDLNDPSQPQ